MAQNAIRVDGLSIPDLVKRLNTDGVICLENAISPEWLDAVRAAVPQYLAQHGERDFLVADVGDDVDGPVHQLTANADLNSLFASLADAGWPRRANTQILQSGLTVRSGWTQKAPPMLFHYDASVVTMVIPIYLPKAEAGASGELVVIPNKRPFRRFLISHAVDKLLTHNSVYRKGIARAAFRKPEDHVVDLEVGNAYVFWGYRSLHGNLPCAPGYLRVTLILQFGEVHRQTAALSLIRSIRRRKIRRMAVTQASVGAAPIRDFSLAC